MEEKEIHPDWPSNDLNDVGWTMARKSVEEAQKRYNLKLFAHVEINEKEFLATVTLYCREINDSFAFAISNDTEPYFPISREFNPLVLPGIKSLAEHWELNRALASLARGIKSATGQ